MSFVCDAMKFSGLSCTKGMNICISQREVMSDLNKDLKKKKKKKINSTNKLSFPTSLMLRNNVFMPFKRFVYVASF